MQNGGSFGRVPGANVEVAENAVAWRTREQNVEDRRGEGGGVGFPARRGMRFPGGGGARGGGIGIIGILIMLGLMFFFGVDPRVIMQGPSGDGFPDIRLPQHDPRPPISRSPGGTAGP